MDCKGYVEILGGDENACYLDLSEGFTVSTHIETDQNIHFKCVQFLILQFYLTKVILKKVYPVNVKRNHNNL